MNETSAQVPVVCQLLAVLVGRPKMIERDGQAALSAIDKQIVTGPVVVRSLNIDGDEQADLTVHGGRDKAVYCYPSEHYDVWRSELGRTLDFGAFGENLVLRGLLEDSVHIGDVLAIGSTLLQVSQPRLPCFKLGIKMGDRGMVRRFQKSERSGFYCRVIQEGSLEAGQPITVIESDATQPTVASIVAAMNKQPSE